MKSISTAAMPIHGISYMLFSLLPFFSALRAPFRERVANVGVPHDFSPVHGENLVADFTGD
jgi:hypothetical protein